MTTEKDPSRPDLDDGTDPELERWVDKDDRPPAKLERRRHRDPEETDERRALERRQHPQHLQHARHARRPLDGDRRASGDRGDDE